MAANVLTVDPADLPTGSEAEIALIPGNEFVRLRVVSEPGGGGAPVTSVTGTDPIVITGAPTTPNVTILPATELDAGSLSASDKTKLDGLPASAWPVTTQIAATVTTPEIAQAAQPAPNATPPNIIISASDAAAGSNDPAGTVVMMAGLSDGTAPQSRFLIVQPTVANVSPQTKLASAKTLFQSLFFSGTNTSSVGLGEPTGVGTQLVLNSVTAPLPGRNSVVSHAVIQMSALDNTTSGQANWICWDATNLLPGAFTGTYDVNTGGAQSDTGIYLQRRIGSVGAGTGAHRFIAITNGGTGEGDGTLRVAFEEHTASTQANLAFYDATGVITSNDGTAWIRLPFGASSTNQPIISMRDNANSQDFALVSMLVGQLFWNPNGMLNTRYVAADTHLWEFPGSAPATAVFRFDNTLGDQPMAILNDGNRSVIHGRAEWPPAKDADREAFFNADTNTTTANQTIATLTPTDNAITTYKIVVIGFDVTGTGDFAAFEHMWSYGKAAGVINAGAGVQPPASDKNHTTAAVGVNLQFAVSGATILVQATPWTTNHVHWTITVDREYANTGTA